MVNKAPRYFCKFDFLYGTAINVKCEGQEYSSWWGKNTRIFLQSLLDSFSVDSKN